MSASIGRGVGILPEVLADLSAPLGDQLRRRLLEWRIIAQLGGSLREIRDTWGVKKEKMAEVSPNLGWNRV